MARTLLSALVVFCAAGRYHLRQDYGQSNHNPAEGAPKAHTRHNVCLNYQKDDCGPKDDFESVQHGERFKGRPFLETTDVLGQELILKDNERLGPLHHVSEIVSLARFSPPCLEQSYLHGFEVDYS